jgi:hypothetical protein
MINLLAVFVAAVVAFILGFLFHGPIGGKLWMKLANVTMTGNEKMSDMYGQMFWNLVANIATATGVAVIYLFASTSSVVGMNGIGLGILCGLLAWICFQVPITSINVIWMKHSKNLWLYEAGCSFVVFAVMGAIVALIK